MQQPNQYYFTSTKHVDIGAFFLLVLIFPAKKEIFYTRQLLAIVIIAEVKKMLLSEVSTLMHACMHAFDTINWNHGRLGVTFDPPSRWAALPECGSAGRKIVPCTRP